MHHTGKKRVQKKKKKINKKKKNKTTKNLLQRDSPNQLELKVNTSIHWTTSLSVDNSSLKEVYIPSLWWLTVFKDDFFGFRGELNL